MRANALMPALLSLGVDITTNSTRGLLQLIDRQCALLVLSALGLLTETLTAVGT